MFCTIALRSCSVDNKKGIAYVESFFANLDPLAYSIRLDNFGVSGRLFTDTVEAFDHIVIPRTADI